MDELKPCPRCHEPQKLRLSISHGGYYMQMRCKVCGWAARPAIGFWLSRLMQSRYGIVTGGLRMDIKTRIDALTEVEAKAALKNIVYSIAVLQPCKAGVNRYCPHWSNCKIVHGKLCDNVWLDEALKEVRK